MIELVPQLDLALVSSGNGLKKEQGMDTFIFLLG